MLSTVITIRTINDAMTHLRIALKEEALSKDNTNKVRQCINCLQDIMNEIKREPSNT